MFRKSRKNVRLPGWLKPAGFASAAVVAGLVSLAGSRAQEEPSQFGVRTTAFRPALDDRSTLLDELGVVRWHQKGWRGQGVKVAVLDSGFRGYRAALGKHLPANVSTKSFRRDGDLEGRDSQHGILCAEIVHTLAPDAEILLANWEPDSADSFARAMAWAKSQGARVATCSVIMPSWSDGAGGGPTHAALREVLGDGQQPRDMVFAAAAGNLAQRHWTGRLAPDSRGDHQWTPGERLNRVAPWGNERVAIELYGALARPCRLQVYDRTTGKLLQEADLRPQVSGGRWWGQTAVRFEPEPNHEYAVALRVLDGTPSATDVPHLVVLGGHLERFTTASSIPFPGDGENILTVGCVDEKKQRLVYSSCGPNSPRPKPDFVAQVPFPSKFRDRPFTGTSAAAPQAAALAALLLSREPDLTPERVRERLRGSALDLLDPGHDGETGFGLLRLP